MNNISHPGSRWQRPEVSYYHQDVLGSVVMVTGRYGHVKERYEYDAYGSPYNGRFEQGNYLNPYGFTGQRYEVELGVYAFAYRTYNPRSMRWITPDPVRDGMNWYQYVNSDPVNLWDPLGLCDESGGFTYESLPIGGASKLNFGISKIENKTTIKINLNPDSNWKVDNKGQISIKSGNTEVKVNYKEGDVSVDRGYTSVQFENGKYYMGFRTKAIIENSTNNVLKAEVESKLIVAGPPDTEGYVPIAQHTVTIGDEKGEVKIENETVVKIKKEVRDIAYVSVGVATGNLVGGITTEKLIDVFNEPLVNPN
jgi:RHS repeat-associated protein